jgi:solute:Na+ symporter, SSS family
MIITYTSSVVILALGITFGFYVKSIGSVTQWLFAALWGGYTAANLLKWYWWRLNGFGYFSGMVAGTVAAIAMPLMFPKLPALQAFPIIFILATIASIAVSLLTPPEDEDAVKKFYKQVRPWGLWGPIYQKLIQEDPGFKKNRDFKRDMFNIAIGIIWQTTLTTVPIYLVIKQFRLLSIAVIIVIVTSVILKKTWLDKLEEC